MLPLHLALEPIVPDRTPEHDDLGLTYGYRLRLPGGPVVPDHDALLRAFGASVVTIFSSDEHEQTLQDDRFEPGSAVRLLPEPFDGDDPGAVRVWDAAAVVEIGELPVHVAEAVAAGLDAGLDPRGLVLSEVRMRADHRRSAVELLVHAPALVAVEPPAAGGFWRPERPSRPRVVLYADGSADIRWWDPTGGSGPADVADLPVSADLVDELRRLRDAFRALEEELSAAGDVAGFEAMEFGWAREELDKRAVRLWRRAQSELGRRYAVGFLGPNMCRPAWSPSALRPDDDEWFDEVPA